MSWALVPGRILLAEPWSTFASSECSSAMGDLGPSWSSAMGGGLGSRGELDGDMAAMVEGARMTLRAIGDEGSVEWLLKWSRWLRHEALDPSCWALRRSAPSNCPLPTPQPLPRPPPALTIPQNHSRALFAFCIYHLLLECTLYPTCNAINSCRAVELCQQSTEVLQPIANAKHSRPLELSVAMPQLCFKKKKKNTCG